MLTLITGVKTKGLYIERPCGAWMEVPIIQNAIIVSAPNMLEHISNGYFKSTKHKVDINGYHDRCSMLTNAIAQAGPDTERIKQCEDLTAYLLWMRDMEIESDLKNETIATQ